MVVIVSMVVAVGMSMVMPMIVIVWVVVPMVVVVRMAGPRDGHRSDLEQDDEGQQDPA
jgi:hypothetical protein